MGASLVCRLQARFAHDRGDAVKSYEVPPARCPSCGYLADAATPVRGMSEAVPKPGDITMCIRCGNVLKFGQSLDLLPVDVDTLPAETRRTLHAMKEALKKARSVS
jgi:hypothetical protein